MDLNSTGISAEPDLSDSWTLLENESSELGVESIDSDGISIISESEEEELQLLPCTSPTVEDRPCSRSSNKYFDETDTSSQCSSGAQDMVGTQSEKKYIHQPNSNLNTSLNVLLVISWAAVVGLGMGHFLGLQEECSSGYSVDDKVKNESQNEELSALLLKKLELENIALKEQFAYLQKMIEEIHQKNTLSTCNDKSLQSMNFVDAAGNHDDDNDLERSECQQESPGMQYSSNKIDQNKPLMSEMLTNDLQPKDNLANSDAHETNIDSNSDFLKLSNEDEKVMMSSAEAIFGKNDILQKLEKSLDDVAALFNDKLGLDKVSKEALSGTISVFSGLLGNLKDKFSGLKSSIDSDSLNLAISKMEEVLQKATDKVQKITEDAFKEGKPLFTISEKVTSKVQAINKKLEEKWCQVKRNLSKQSVIWSWLEGQIFQNCTDDNHLKEDKVRNDIDGNKKLQNPIHASQEEQMETKKIKRVIDESNATKEKNVEITRHEKKTKVKKNYIEPKNKQNSYKNNYKSEFGKLKDRYKINDFVDPNSFDFKYISVKGRNKENVKPSQNGERETFSSKRRPYLKETKNAPDQNFQNGVSTNAGKYGKTLTFNQSGEWVEALFNHRAERRRDERRSDWFFARARSRTRTRERDSQPSRWYLRRGETHTRL